MQKGYLSVPSADAEKQPWFNEKQYSPASPLIVEESKSSSGLTRWINRISFFFMSSRQKEKSTRKSVIIRSRTRGIKLLATLLFCTVSMYFIHRFIGNYIQLSLPTETVSDLFKAIPSSDYIKQYATIYSSKSHLASSDADKDLAHWTRDSWIKFGVTDTKIETYWPLLNYPNQTRLAVIQGPSELLYESPVNSQSGPFHAYSGNGDVTGPVVYVNYGRLADFQFLMARGISFKGTVALIRNGIIKKGLKVKMAEDFGCIGAVLFSDPDDTNITAIGPAVIEQGSVQYSSYIVGDPLTQGYAAATETNATHRITYDQATGIPKIPSLPVSWQDAEALLKTTEGFGIESDVTWIGGICDLSYYSGPSEALINLVNFNDYKVRPIWNVVGKITGSEEPNRAVIIGNHRDAWSHGAMDPSSGSAVLMELVRTIGVLIKRGWRPRRTLIIASWDAQEYGSVGSTEWVEDHQSWLKEEAVAYLNVDYAVSGKKFSAQSSPILDQLLYQVTKEVVDPHTSQTVYDVWKSEKISGASDTDRDFYFESSPPDSATPLTEPLGSDSDYAAFFNHLGISSLSFGFRGEEHVRHTFLDTITRVEETVDPTFEYHQTLTKIWGLMVLHLTSDILLPMHSLDYSIAIVNHMDRLISQRGCLSLPYISSALHSLSATSYHFEKKRNKWAHKFAVHKHFSKKLKKHAAKANERIMKFERTFIDPLGIGHERPWFKHVVYGPDLNTGLAKEFPGLSDAVENDNTVYIRYIEERIGKILLDAERALRGKSNDFEEEDDDDEDDDY
ncbi:hypothetical protein HPULCUR_002481 [Helicostylum pulchrum]|uniref:Zn-dependent exopeptidase n=1 Tax=Helicostylum pulchrum TaxID=562976 RepID=A0ABP9XQQ7_9FUNG